MNAAPNGGAPAPRRSGTSGGGWAVIGCVGCGALVIILAAVIGIVVFFLNRDEISPRSTETIETETYSFEAPSNWEDFASTADESVVDWHYNSQAPGGGEQMVVGRTHDAVDPTVVCDSIRESIDQEPGGGTEDAPAETFDGVESTGFTGVIGDDMGSVSLEYHCLADGDHTVVVGFIDAGTTARTGFGDDLIESWIWKA